MKEKIESTIVDACGELVVKLGYEALSPLSKSIGRLFGFLYLPMNYLYEKENCFFNRNLEKYKNKLEEIAEDKRVQVIPEIGVPILQKLQYTTNEELADLFTTLLASASNKDKEHLAHPAFIDIISRMTPDEAKIVKFITECSMRIPYCAYYGALKTSGYAMILKYATSIINDINLSYSDNNNAYFENLINLGIFQDNDGRYLIDDSLYEEINKKYLGELEQKYVPNKYESIKVNKSYFSVTDFGKLFIDACVIK